MASPNVRQWFIDLINRLVPEAPFQETDGIMVETKGLPEVWSTCEFDIGSNQRLTIGRGYIEREYGTCTVAFLIKAGRGPMVGLRIAEEFANIALLSAPDGTKVRTCKKCGTVMEADPRFV